MIKGFYTRFLILIACCCITSTIKATNFLLQVPPSYLHDQGLQLTIADLTVLFEHANTRLFVNETASIGEEVIIRLQIDTTTLKSKPIVKDSWKLPTYDLSYSITLKPDSILLHAHSFPGFSAAMYGLLQDVLGFSFYHPRQTKFPDLSNWKVTETAFYQSKPRFDKIGFHLHTMHPTELAEALLNAETPNAFGMVKEYIDWLVRNRQNYFEFNLLNSIDLDTWLPHAERMVNYMQQRGVIAGLDLSLNMLQQKAFQLYKSAPFSFKDKEKQLIANIDILFQVPWDVWNVEFSATEFTAGNTGKKIELLSILHQKLIENHCKLVSRKHVVRKEEMVSDNSNKKLYESDTIFADKQRGIFIHTVMFYTLQDSFAPVYQNQNLLHMQTALIEEQQKRETWYFPESAYWVNFDNSVPIFLPTYLSARLSDILFCDSLDIDGHVTFSSGWEWGYWLIDWSIANWSWETSVDGKVKTPSATEYFYKLTNNPTQTQFLSDMIDLHNRYVRDSNLIKYISVQTVSDEIPFDKYRLQFQPRPDWQYRWLSRHADTAFLKQLLQTDIALLDIFIREYEALFKRYESKDINNAGNPFYTELKTALEVVLMRAKHRRTTLLYLIHRRLQQIQPAEQADVSPNHYLTEAIQIRTKAIGLVRTMGQNYRYPLEDLSMPRLSKTVYQFGYLYTTHDLFFWEREEQQALSDKWGPLFMNIWDIPAILGIKKRQGINQYERFNKTLSRD